MAENDPVSWAVAGDWSVSIFSPCRIQNQQVQVKYDKWRGKKPVGSQTRERPRLIAYISDLISTVGQN